MSAFIPVWSASDESSTATQLMSAYTLPTTQVYGAELSGRAVPGNDDSLGYGEFIWAQMSNATGCNAGNVCEITQTLLSSGASISLVNSVQQWTGAANSGKPLCVALTTLTQNQFGWFQIFGPALVTTNAAVSLGQGAYWNANGVVQGTAVASKQAIGMQCVVASSASFGQATGGVTPTLTSTQAIYYLDYPVAQGAIT